MRLKHSDKAQFLKAVLITIILSEMYFYPFESDFRFSAGIIVLNLIFLLYSQISCIKLSMASGIAIIVLRVIGATLIAGSSLEIALLTHMPSLGYYVVFGLLHELRKNTHKRFHVFALLLIYASVDGIANVTETFLRGTVSFDILQLIFLISVIRIVISYGLYLVIKANELYIRNSEHQKRYTQLNILVSNIQTDLFYLNKSQKDIESVMRSSHALYSSLSDQPVYAEKALEISRSVHEIKKDYSRVLAGFNAFINGFEKDDSMALKDAFMIIKGNTEKLICEFKKENLIDLVISNEDDFTLKNYYALFTMINNLIINSIEASDVPIQIKLKEYSDPEYIYFEVQDNGIGIQSDLFPYLFNPGFTTKFDAVTGKASTGIGLSHVKSTLEGLCGTLEFSSIPYECTVFTMKIPKNQLVRSIK